MDTHKNAPVTPKGREAMVRFVIDSRKSKAAAARQFNTTAKTVAKWVERFRTEGVERINHAYPRLGIKERFKEDVCGVVKRKPHCAHGGIAPDFGARYVLGFQPVSAADLVANALYSE